MPVIFVKLEFNYNNLYESIKCYVIIFWYLFFIFGIMNFLVRYVEKEAVYRPLVLRSKPLVPGRRYYCSKATNSDLKDISKSKKKSYRNNLGSPESRPYADLYKGRGIPKNEPTWVKDNGMERSPFGASWARNSHDRLPFPGKYPCNYRNILDPYNNRKSIKEICKGNRVVYIWTYVPTGVCLVGSSSNSVERVLSYFERKYLFLEKRRGVQFLADYGFKDVQLTIIYYNYQNFTAFAPASRDCRPRGARYKINRGLFHKWAK